MTGNFTIEQIRMLAQSERDMDEGRVPFVRPHGTQQRMSVDREILDELGLVSGQSVSDVIVTAILQAKIASLKAQIEMRDKGIT